MKNRSGFKSLRAVVFSLIILLGMAPGMSLTADAATGDLTYFAYEGGGSGSEDIHR